MFAKGLADINGRVNKITKDSAAASKATKAESTKSATALQGQINVNKKGRNSVLLLNMHALAESATHCTEQVLHMTLILTTSHAVYCNLIAKKRAAAQPHVLNMHVHCTCLVNMHAQGTIFAAPNHSSVPGPH